jgi:glycosyltransferase involved in cell wall biosynthesis
LDLKLPSISIVVAVHNGARTLQRCIDSVSGQSYARKELLVMDGGSTDGSVDILEANAAKITDWESKPDRGIYHAWNKGVDRSNGDWICFLGADDFFWQPDVLQRMAPRLDELDPKIRIAYGQVAIVDETGKTLDVSGSPWVEAKRHLFCMPGPHPGMMHHRTLFEERGRFDESFGIAGDYEFLLRELKKNDAFFVSDIIVAGMQFGGISSTPRNSLRILREEARARLKNGLAPINCTWTKAYARGLLRNVASDLLGERQLRRLAIRFGRLLGRPSAWEKFSDAGNVIPPKDRNT